MTMIQTDSLKHLERATFCFEERFLSLFSYLEEGWLCDVDIVCDDGRVPAHRVILAATSSYFKRMFSCDMKESSSKEVRMYEISTSTLQTILRYLYTTELDITPESALSVLKAANLLCLPAVEEACCAVLLGPLSPSTAVDYSLLAEQFGMSQLLDATVQVLVQNSKEMNGGGVFERLGLLTFQRVLQSDDLEVKDEKDVFTMLSSWVEHDRASRTSHFTTLLEHVRLPLLHPGYLVDVVEKSPLVRGDLRCRDLVDEAKNRHLLPARTHGFHSERMTPRRSTVGYIFLVGGLSVKERSLLSSVERYDLPLQQSSEMPDMSLPRSGLGCAIMDNALYVIGGHDGSKSLKVGESLDFGKGVWTWTPQLQVPRRNLAMCADESRLYAVGGQVNSSTTLDTLETYDPREGLWRCHKKTMQSARKYGAMCYLNNSLFVVGGNDGTHYLSSCERYDIRAAKWAPVAPLPHAFGANGLTVWGDHIATVGGFDSRHCLDVVYLYSPTTDTWAPLPTPMSTKRTGLGAVSAAQSLYVLGGHSGENYLDTVEMFDGSQWTPLAPISCKRGAMGIAVLQNRYMPS